MQLTDRQDMPDENEHTTDEERLEWQRKQESTNTGHDRRINGSASTLQEHERRISDLENNVNNLTTLLKEMQRSLQELTRSAAFTRSE